MTAETETMAAVTETVQNTDNSDIDIQIDPMVKQLNSMAELLDVLAKTSKSLTTEMKALTKDVNKLRLSKGGKKVKKVANPDSPRKLGALEKPVPISDELAEFLGLTKGETQSRQFITKSINAYVKEHDLQNPENRRYILLDSEKGLKLKALLRDPDQPLTFFNIQRYLKVHYPKVESDEEDSKKKTVDVTDKTEKKAEKKADKVVEDAATVDETEGAPKKKVVRKVVKKAGSATA